MSDYKQTPGYYLPADAAKEIDRIISRHLSLAVKLSHELKEVIDRLTPAQKAIALDYIQGHPLNSDEAAFHGGTSGKH